jgi:biopolymer transport protein ExbB
MTLPVVELVNALASAGGGGGSAKDTLVTFFHEGGIFVYGNTIILAIAVGLVIERAVTLGFRYALNEGPFMEQVTKLVMSGNVDRAVKLCGAAPNSPIAKVIRAGLTRANKGETEIAKSVEESMLENTPLLQARIQWLWSIANIATLVGLIGTVVDLIKTFKSLGNVPADQKQAMLSAGISGAMNNTAYGLSIAVTCIISHLVLTAYSKHKVESLELNAMKLENLLARRAAGELAPVQAEESRA